MGEIGQDGGSETANGESAERPTRDKTRRHVPESWRRARDLVARACVADVFAVFAESALRDVFAESLGADVFAESLGADVFARRRIARDALKVRQQEPRQQQRQQQLQLQPERLAERQSAAERPRRAAAA